MNQTPEQIIDWPAPAVNALGDSHIDFLRILKNPTWITVKGKDASRSRAIVTLLHGNEPSGLKAVHDFLKSGEQPATNLGIFVASVNAALDPPILSQRFLPGEEDLNRCFNPPVNTHQRALAKNLLQQLRDFAPEAIVDTHNTSGRSLPFAVSICADTLSRQLTQVFTHRLVVIDQALGTLMEQREMNCPVVTIEFGGFTDPDADALATKSLYSFISTDQLFSGESMPLQILRNPLRLEIDRRTTLRYSSMKQSAADITLFDTIDQMNFSRLKPGTALGWITAKGLAGLNVLNAKGEDLASVFFTEENGLLITLKTITLFMATTDPDAAHQDCLLYLTSEYK
ncbi:MAG: succinylglutamate desuccinylase [Candidatus Azotimanducaceae bacterium]|jgi:succinylglutamate desuccinylase